MEVLSPETIAGVKAVLRDTDWYLEYQGKTLDAGSLSREEISPAACLPRLMNALRDGWLLEENEETWNEVPCLRISVDGKIILTAEFTAFSFYDTIDNQGA